MRIHFAAAALVLIAGLAVGVSRVELVALMIAAALVIVAELLNTAVEAAIDVATTSFDPRAKVAKDVAAGAVLVCAFIAVLVGYLVFAERLQSPASTALSRVRESPVHLTVIAFVLVVLVVVAVKAATGRGTSLRGGLPSGHAAVAFAGWAAILFITADSRHNVLVASITLPDGAAGGADAGRGRDPHADRGHLRGRRRRPRRARDLPGLGVTGGADRAPSVTVRASRCTRCGATLRTWPRSVSMPACTRPGALVAGVADGRVVLVRMLRDAAAGEAWLAAHAAGLPVPAVELTRCAERPALVAEPAEGEPLGGATPLAVRAQAAPLGRSLAAHGIAARLLQAHDLTVRGGVLVVRAPVEGTPDDVELEAATLAATVEAACAGGPAPLPRRRPRREGTSCWRPPARCSWS